MRRPRRRIHTSVPIAVRVDAQFRLQRIQKQVGRSMSLPIVVLDRDEKWACHRCGFCCRGSLIPLSTQDLARLKSQRWEEEPEFRNLQTTVPFGSASGSIRLAHRADGSCIFLSDEGLCRIHLKFGIEAKPTVCQTFPLQLIPHQKQVVLTLRRACPSAAADLGHSIGDQLPFIRQLVHDKQLKADSVAPPHLKPGEARDWKPVRAVLECAAQLMQDERYPPVRRIVHTLQFAGLLSKAKTSNLSDSQIGELARTLVELTPEESKPFFAERQEPKGYSKTLFRLLAIDCARLHPECGHKPKWSSRLQLINTAWRIALGRGRTPHVDKVFPTANFSELEKPFGALSPELYRPLSRFLETSSGSFLYALADRHGWSVIESIRGLALLFPVGLWLMRWRSHGREPTVQDMLNIVVALDRSQGYAPLGGSLHRGRLSTLATNEELERLVVWYAQ